MKDLMKRIRDFVTAKKATVKPIFPNIAASLEMAEDQKAAADILGVIASNAVSNMGDTPEDAVYAMKVGVTRHIKEMLRQKARKDAKDATFDGEKWSTYNPVNSVVNAAEKFGFEGAEDTYQEFFEEFTPEVNECEKCNSFFVGEDCLTCENRRFESDHR